MGPLQGVKIIDMTSVLMGPYATQMLGDYGADVIKVESPEGDITRLIGPARDGDMGPLFLNCNRSKRSIVLDLKKPAGRDALLKLAASADVLVYNVRPQAMARLKLGYDDVAAVNPRLVYAGLFGFGQDGPYAAKPAYDDLLQGSSGLSHLIARANDGAPRYVPTALADRVVGLTAVGAILASIVHRDRTGKGQRVDVPMFETMASFVLGDHLGGLTYDPPLDQGGYPRHLAKDRRPYETADGFISVIVYNDKQWKNFFDAIDRDDLRNDPRFATFHGRLAQHRPRLWRARPHHQDAHHRRVAGLLRQGRHPGDAGAQPDQHPRRSAPEGGRLLPGGRASDRGQDPQHASLAQMVGYAGRDAAARTTPQRACGGDPERGGIQRRRDCRSPPRRRDEN